MVNQLIKIKKQSEVVMVEAKRCSDMFDEAFRLAIYKEFRDGNVITWDELNHVKRNSRISNMLIK